jgi:hypothetical protein
MSMAVLPDQGPSGMHATWVTRSPGTWFGLALDYRLEREGGTEVGRGRRSVTATHLASLVGKACPVISGPEVRFADLTSMGA